MSLLGNLTVGILGNMGGLSDTFTDAQRQVKNFGKKMEDVGKNLSTIGTTMTAAITVPIAGLATAAVKSSIEFESAFAGVVKTVDATTQQLAELRQGIRKMAKEIPVAATEIAGIAEMAGQLGIQTENIMGFTRVMADLSVATNMTSEQAATDLARLANITQMPQKEFDRLGSSIVALGNNFATTESEIVAMALRLAGQGAQIGLTEAQINALATAMSSVGIEAEAGGTAMSTVMKKMQTAVMDNGKMLTRFAKASKMSAKDFASQWKKDPIVAMDSLIKGLAKSSKEGGNLSEILADLGIKGIREQDTLLRLSGAADLLSNAVGISTKAWKENNALTKEAETRYGTTESQLQILKNRFKDILVTLGDAFVPALVATMQALDPVIVAIEKAAKWFGDLNPKAQAVAIVMGAIVAAIGPVLMILGLMISSVGSVITAFAGLSGAIASAGGIIAVLTGPISLTIAAIAGLGIALVALWKNSESFREKVTGVFNKVKEVGVQAFEIVASFIGEKIAQIKQFWDENGSQFLAAVTNVFNGIMAVVKFVMPAIQFLIEMVWTAIKQVISGALNVIMGLIKVFSGLFTGDFSKMWEGIKQIFFGAIDLIIGWMSLTFVGGLRTLFTNLLKNSLGLVRNLGTGIVNLFKSFTSIGSNLAKGMVNGVLGFFRNLFNSGKSIFTMLKNFGASSFSAMRQTITSIAQSIFTITKTKFTNLLNSVRSIFGTVRTVISDIWSKVMSFFQGINLTSIGKDIIRGLINGIGSMASAVWEKAKSIASGIGDSIKKVLDIHSPSRVTTKLGKHAGQGLENGLSKKAKAVAAAAKKTANEAIKNLEVKFDTKKISATKYINELKKIQKNLKLTGDQSRKVKKEIYQANQSIEKQAQALKTSINKINNGVKTADSNFLDKVKSINSKLKSDIKKVQDDFKKQLADLGQSIYNQTGLFSEVKNEKKDSNILLNNLKNQNKQFKQWQKDLSKLQKSGVSKSFIDELRAMGVNSADEINAIANMPKSRLNEYVKAWKEKHELANKEANVQMAQAKKDMKNQIKNLNAAAKKELDKAKADWVAKVKSFSSEIKKLGDFRNSGKVLAKDTVKGLINGFSSMKGPLAEEAKKLAKTIEKTVKKALKIKSPSRLMRDEVGKFIPLGIVEGIAAMKSRVVTAAEEMANAAIPDIPSVEIPAATLKNGNSIFGDSSTNTDIQDNSSIIGLLRALVNKSGDVYLGADKVGEFVDKDQAKRTNLAGRRVAF